MGSRALAFASAVVALAASGCGSSGSSSSAPTTTTLPAPVKGCTDRPVPGAPLPWLPADLPLPPGTYAVQELASSTDAVHKGVLAVPVTVRAFVVFALDRWRREGWRLGRGDAERGEAEDDFVKAGNVGRFRIRAAYCDTHWSELTLVVGTRTTATTPP